MSDIFEVEEILGSRQTSSGGSEYRIRWKGFGASDDTWEPEENLIKCEEILSAYKRNMAEKSTRRQTRTLLKTPVSSRMSAFDKLTTRNSNVPSNNRDVTPVLQRTRLRQRNTPKVQRVLGVKQIPSTVSVDKQETSKTEISSGRAVKCNKWAMVGGLLCFLTGFVLLYLTVD